MQMHKITEIDNPNPFIKNQMGRPFDLSEHGHPREKITKEIGKRIDNNRISFQEWLQTTLHTK